MQVAEVREWVPTFGPCPCIGLPQRQEKVYTFVFPGHIRVDGPSPNPTVSLLASLPQVWSFLVFFICACVCAIMGVTWEPGP